LESESDNRNCQESESESESDDGTSDSTALAVTNSTSHCLLCKSFRNSHISIIFTIELLQPLRWCCVECVIHHERDVCEEQHHTYMWREQATIE